MPSEAPAIVVAFSLLQLYPGTSYEVIWETGSWLVYDMICRVKLQERKMVGNVCESTSEWGVIKCDHAGKYGTADHREAFVRNP